jgi:hypothetical protein
MELNELNALLLDAICRELRGVHEFCARLENHKICVYHLEDPQWSVVTIRTPELQTPSHLTTLAFNCRSDSTAEERRVLAIVFDVLHNLGGLKYRYSSMGRTIATHDQVYAISRQTITGRSAEWYTPRLFFSELNGSNRPHAIVTWHSSEED